VRRSPAVLAVVCSCAAATSVVHATGTTHRSAGSWRGDYETGNFAQWTEVQASRNNPNYPVSAVGDTKAEIVRAPVRQGRYAARFITYASRSAPNGDRAEVYTSVGRTGGLEGRQRYYAWSTMFPGAGNPRGFWPRAGDFNVFTQWHNEVNGCGNNLQLGIAATGRSNRLYSDLSIHDPGDCDHQTGTFHSILGKLRFDAWYDFIVHVEWSSRRNVGSYEIWMNGRQVVHRKLGATLWNSSGAYWKQGFYRAAFDANNTVYQDGAVVGRSLGAVSRNFRLRFTRTPRILSSGAVSIDARSFSQVPVELIVRDGRGVVGRARGRTDSSGHLHDEVTLKRLPVGLGLRAILLARVSARLPLATRRTVLGFALPGRAVPLP
jgi:hypothetical protein